ncbi:MAG: type I glyceraldehyde-3-phosphate dehydrogenase [candidate division WOR-3 bacterium]|nr:type I glyceraldehyde-3-phosphate dehydrogenase [candidate division WOR-3 bacterium]
MAVCVGLNGFGRIGRCVLRGAMKRNDIDIVGINDIADVDIMAHLLKFDSVYRKFDGEVSAGDNSLVVNNVKIPFFHKRDPETLPWKDLNVDVVMEATGIFRKRDDAAKHLKAGAKKIIITAPSKGDRKVPAIVYGVNHKEYDPKKDDIVSNASCTTNCFAPVVKVLHESFGIKHGLMTTSHAYTTSQRILDLPHKDWRRARAAALSIIPTTTGAAIATTEVIPELKGKLNAIALRVPVPDGAVVDFVCEVERETTEEEVNKAFKKYAEGELSGVLEYNEDPIVSMDIIGNPHSSIFDSGFTTVIDHTLVKVLSWYDNEWGFSMRLIDVAVMMGETL